MSRRPDPGPVRPARRGRFAALLGPLIALLLVAACADGPVSTSPIRAGTAEHPREVNLIAKDYAFLPPVLDLVPGETVLLHVVNGGTDLHEAVIGDDRVQEAWEIAEAATAGAPPGPTPTVSVPPDVAGLRVVVRSGERVDVTWAVPGEVASTPGTYLVGCHIPGHYAQGMAVAVRWVGHDGQPLESSATPSGSPIR